MPFPAVSIKLIKKTTPPSNIVAIICSESEIKNHKVEYTDNSKLNRLRLEDSFLPGALQNPIRNIPEQFLIPLAYARWLPYPNQIIRTGQKTVYQVFRDLIV